jgi:hypothetical protein
VTKRRELGPALFRERGQNNGRLVLEYRESLGLRVDPRDVVEQPSPIFVDRDRDHVVLGFVEVSDDGSRRDQRDFMFAGSAAVENCNA